MCDGFPILAVPIPIPYTTFTWWVPGAVSIAVMRVSSPFRYHRSLHYVFSKLNMPLVFFTCVSGNILLIAVANVPMGTGRVPL